MAEIAYSFHTKYYTGFETIDTFPVGRVACEHFGTSQIVAPIGGIRVKLLLLFCVLLESPSAPPITEARERYLFNGGDRCPFISVILANRAALWVLILLGRTK